MNRLENCGQRVCAGGDGFGEVAANMRQSAVFVEAVTVMRAVALSMTAPLSMTMALAVATFLLGLTVVSMFLLGMRVPALAAVLSGTLTLLSFKGKDLGILATAHAIGIGCVVVAGCCGGSVRYRSTGVVGSGLGVGGGALGVRVSHASTLPSALAGR
ncbi:predicted membrane metal-binding protein [Rothia mucilaginosa DY-18]|uniref:Predicted membrane metal-binding protein n=1 Tax=Rothia mucilaginosa (strain DY-18) TaxID=680646 RepID=D2NTC2_ROTMD|nr:predicted membrane metal-binding protein [Rothia mucilaginosa DY-18]